MNNPQDVHSGTMSPGASSSYHDALNSISFVLLFPFFCGLNICHVHFFGVNPSVNVNLVLYCYMLYVLLPTVFAGRDSFSFFLISYDE